jgi:hypothetical protein
MEMRARRDHFIVIFLSFFVLVTGFFVSQSMFAAALSMVAVVGLLAALLVASCLTAVQPHLRVAGAARARGRRARALR